MDAPLALYRRYRPETFAEVIGQEHVTDPLRAALRGNRVNHAYLFSGPRGCGKTTSARILARALNCEQGPTDIPCGQCRSCTDLARGGPGSVDVIEIDAASHGGVDDARDLRERAFFAPVASRYKVYIIDEAHMVTTQGFNALLKLVEEPPPHLKFIFATTEPEKVIGTIRSRTHHYPFRLIPPRVLTDYLGQLCQQEGIGIEPAALPLVVRAGGGSARDTLSILDQLMGGATASGITYELTTNLLGYTPDSLLDEVVDAFAAHDAAAVFAVVDRVIETGQDPRRFTEDLLRRLRDLLILAAVPDAVGTGLVDVPAEVGERLLAQSARFGHSELSRAADLVAAGLADLKGATAPRLLLELLCSRVLLPAADDQTQGLAARLDRLERRLDVVGQPAPAHQVAAPRAAPPITAPPQTAQAPAAQRPAVPAEQARPPAATTVPAASQPSPPSPAQDRDLPSASPTAPQQGFSVADARRVWPSVVDEVRTMRRATWALMSQYAQVVSVEGKTLTLGFKTAGTRDQFGGSGHAEIIRQAFIRVIGQDLRVEGIVDPGAQTINDSTPARTAAPARGDRPPAPASGAAPAEPSPSAAGGSSSALPTSASENQPPGWAAPGVGPEAAEPTAARPRVVDPAAIAEARQAIAGTRPPGFTDRAGGAEADAEVDLNDPDAEDSGLSGAALLQEALGASIIDETHHE